MTRMICGIQIWAHNTRYDVQIRGIIRDIKFCEEITRCRDIISSQSKRKKLLFVRLIDNGDFQIVPLTSPDLVSSSPVITTDPIGTVWDVDLDAQLIVIVIILSSFDIMDLTMALSLLRIYSPLHQRLQPIR
jgi:hypothetical protein